MNLVQIIASIQVVPSIERLEMWPCVLWNVYKRALIQYGIQDGCQRRKILLWDFSYMNISKIRWVKFVLIAMDVCFL